MKEKEDAFPFVFPYGCTLSVNRPSVVGITSGIATFPVDRPIAALYCHNSGIKYYNFLGMFQRNEKSYVARYN